MKTAIVATTMAGHFRCIGCPPFLSCAIELGLHDTRPDALSDAASGADNTVVRPVRRCAAYERNPPLDRLDGQPMIATMVGDALDRPIDTERATTFARLADRELDRAY